MIRYCKFCGGDVSFLVPSGDTHPRHVCRKCGHIHYENPKLVVGCVVEWKGKILLCRRAIEPQLGFWTLPAGFMENGETTAQGATRETYEEAGAEVEIDAAFAMISIAHINQVHLFYRGKLLREEYSAGDESLETKLFAPDDIPWTNLAFRSIKMCLELYLSDRAHGRFCFHENALAPA